MADVRVGISVSEMRGGYILVVDTRLLVRVLAGSGVSEKRCEVHR